MAGREAAGHRDAETDLTARGAADSAMERRSRSEMGEPGGARAGRTPPVI